MFCKDLLGSLNLQHLFAPVFPFSFCLDDLSVGKSGILKSHTQSVRVHWG